MINVASSAGIFKCVSPEVAFPGVVKWMPRTLGLMHPARPLPAMVWIRFVPWFKPRVHCIFDSAPNLVRFIDQPIIFILLPCELRIRLRAAK
jgi:hypothetical protein